MVSCVVLYTASLFAFIWALYVILRRENRGMLIMTPFLLYCMNELIRVWPAGIYARYQGISQDNFASIVLISCTFAFLAGFALFRYSDRVRQHSPFAFWQKPMCLASPHGHLVAIVVVGSMLAAVGFFFYQGVPPGLTGLVRLVQEGYMFGVNSFVNEQRLALTKGHHFGGAYRGQGIARAAMSVGWPMITSIALLLYFQRRERFWFLAGVALLLATFVFVSGDGTRGRILWAMITIVFVVSLVARVRMRSMAIFAGTLLLVLFSLSAVDKFSGAASRGALLSEGSQRIANRIFVGNGLNTVHVIELVRAQHVRLRLGDVHRTEILNALPMVHGGEPFAYELFLLLNPEAKEEATTFLSMTYLGKVYVDFGWVGSIVCSFLFGALLAFASQFLYSFNKTALNTAIIGVFSMQLGRVNLAGVTPIISYLMVFIPIYCLYVFTLSIATMRRSQIGRRVSCAR